MPHDGARSVRRRQPLTLRICRTVAALLLIWLCISSSCNWVEPSRAFVTAGTSSAQGRRALLGAVLSGAAVMPIAQPAAFAQDAAPPPAVVVTGFTGSEPERFNGKWNVALGSKINKKPVYKRVGEDYFLLFNDCGQFMISTEISGNCNGIAVNTKEGWKFGDKVMPTLKVKPLRAGDPEPESVSKGVMSPEEKRNLVKNELAKLEAENNSDNFYGKLDNDEEKAAERLMGKLSIGSKVVGR